MFTEAAMFTVLILAVTAFLSYRGFTDPAFRARYLFDSRRIYPGGEFVRLLSSGFLHANWIHLALNMWVLYLFGGMLEKAAGPVLLLAVYFASIVGGSLLSLALHLGKPHLALGASGGVSGLVLAQVFLFPGGSMFVFPIPVPIPSWLFAIGFIAYSILGIRSASDGIGHDAHLGGALIGLFTATAFYPEIFSANRPLYLAVVLLAGGFLLTTLRGGRQQRRPRMRLVRVARPPAEPPRRKPEPPASGPDEDREAVIDLLLEKISRGGMESLTPEERALLERLSHGR